MSPLAQEKVEHSRGDSLKLLQEELSKLKSKKIDRKRVLKIHQGIVVLQARQVLASLLAKWSSESPRLSTAFLGSLDVTEYFSLLDILLKDQKLEMRKKVSTVHTVLPCNYAPF